MDDPTEMFPAEAFVSSDPSMIAAARVDDEDELLLPPRMVSPSTGTPATKEEAIMIDRVAPLLETYPSFQLLSTPIPSLELLNPLPDSDLRKSDTLPATFNLIATIVGGGVLSMPLAVAKSGLLLGTGLMILGAITTDFSLFILSICARKTGATSYGAVARSAFGPGLELVTTLCLFAYLFLVLIAFMVLIKGIWAPLVIALWQNFQPDDMAIGKHADNIVLLAAMLLTMPFFLSRDLHGLRYSCYASFCSIGILCLAMIYRGCQKNMAEPELFSNQVVLATSNMADILFAYPIMLLAFVSSFNIIEVNCALINPTRERVRTVIDVAVFWSFVLMLIFALAGYVWSYDETKGNILLNFDPSDPIILVGRISCGVCTLLAMPMSLLPCRNALLALPIQYLEWREWQAMSKQEQLFSLEKRGGMTPVQCQRRGLLLRKFLRRECDSSPDNENQRLLIKRLTSPRHYSSTNNRVESAAPVQVPLSPRMVKVVQTSDRIPLRDRIVHWSTTLCILTLCYIAAVIVPGVAIVWSIVGSSLAFLVQYIFPSACFIKLCGKNGRFQRQIPVVWGLLVLSCVGAIACTAQTVWRIFFMEPEQ